VPDDELPRADTADLDALSEVWSGQLVRVFCHFLIQRSRVILLLLVEKVLSRVPVRDESRRNLGHEILDLGVLDRRQQCRCDGINHGVVKIHFVLQERPIKGLAVRLLEGAHRLYMRFGKREVFGRRRSHAEGLGEITALGSDISMIAYEHFSEIAHGLRAALRGSERAAFNIIRVRGVEYRYDRRIVELGTRLGGSG
jgi:hypothetical protein